MSFWKKLFSSKGAIDSVPKQPPIIIAATKGDLEKVKKLLNDNPDLVFSTDNEDKSTLLHIAAQNGHKDVAELLINKDVDVHAKNKFVLTPLHYAATKGHEDLAELLIENGADVNVKSGFQDTPLHKAASQGHKDVVELLIDMGAEVNANNEHKETPLHLAASQGHKDVAKLLIGKGADVNAKGNFAWSPLHYATGRDFYFMADLFRASGIDSALSLYRNSSLGIFTVHKIDTTTIGHNNIVELLLENGADVNAMAIGGADLREFTPLHWSVMIGNTGLAKLLLHYGANVNSCSYPNAMPLHFAAYLGYTDLAELLINKGADVNAFTLGGSPLQFAMAGKSYSNQLTVSLLRKHGGHEEGTLIPSSRFSETGLIG